MAELLFGVETEYAIAAVPSGGVVDRGEMLQALMERARRELVHLPDLHASGGMFLGNGARFYVDCGSHPELCTPECANPWDVVRYIQAGNRILFDLTAQIESTETEVMFFRCNVDYSGAQTTWGCHESYMHQMALDALQPHIIPHLVSRLVYTGAGGFNPLSQGLEFTLSPRSAHFQRLITENSTSERGIWHSKSESLCSGYSRLHVLCGESLCSETAIFLKVGATALIVALANAGYAPGAGVQLAEPVIALQTVAGDITCRKRLQMVDGRLLTAVEIQRRYLEQVETHLGDAFLPPWAAEVCSLWRAQLDQLEEAPGSASKTLDWGIKLAVYADHARSRGICWDDLLFWNQIVARAVSALAARRGRSSEMPLERALDPKRPFPKELLALAPLLEERGLHWDDLRNILSQRQMFFEIDTRFGQLGPRGIFETLDGSGVLHHRVRGVDNIEQAMAEPPATGRARIRGQVIQRLARTSTALCDWQSVVDFGGEQGLDLSDPFAAQELWQPLGREQRRSSRTGGSFDMGAYLAGAYGPGADARRQDAADRLLRGDFAGAEVLLRGLVRERYMLSSTHCHLARVLLMTDREAEAREQTELAWAARRDASAYVVARVLFFQCLFTMFDGGDIACVVGKMRSALEGGHAHLDWTILPMLHHLRPRLGEGNYRFMKALGETLSDAARLPQLRAFAQWHSVVEVALETETERGPARFGARR